MCRKKRDEKGRFVRLDNPRNHHVYLTNDEWELIENMRAAEKAIVDLEKQAIELGLPKPKYHVEKFDAYKITSAKEEDLETLADEEGNLTYDQG